MWRYGGNPAREEPQFDGAQAAKRRRWPPAAEAPDFGCFTGQGADVKKEGGSSPDVVENAVSFVMTNKNGLERKDELATGFPTVPNECDDCGSGPNPGFALNKKLVTMRRSSRLKNRISYAMEKREERDGDEEKKQRKRLCHRSASGDEFSEEWQEDGEVDQTEETKCPVDGCSEKFPSAEDLAQHIRNHPTPLVCGICRRSFTSFVYIRRHYNTHTGARPYKCDECVYSASEPSTLRKHKRMHTGEKPFTCIVCNKKFSRSDHLTVHMRSHTGERPYKCEICGYATVFSSAVKKHKRTHTGDKPFSCTCGYKTVDSFELKRHKKRLAH